jgi:hypothetical protein
LLLFIFFFLLCALATELIGQGGRVDAGRHELGAAKGSFQQRPRRLRLSVGPQLLKRGDLNPLVTKHQKQTGLGDATNLEKRFERR